jgi:hypothetical protein
MKKTLLNKLIIIQLMQRVFVETRKERAKINHTNYDYAGNKKSIAKSEEKMNEKPVTNRNT